MKRAPRVLIPAVGSLAILAFLSAAGPSCFTINIQFPAGEISDAARNYVREIMESQGEATGGTPRPPDESPPKEGSGGGGGGASGGFGWPGVLVPVVLAADDTHQATNIRIDTPTIEAIKKAQKERK